MATKKPPKSNPPKVKRAASKPKPSPIPRTAKATATRVTKAKLKAQRVAEEYVASAGNKAQAARAAGSKAKNATQAANEILKKPEVQEEIGRFADECRSQRVLTGRQVLERLTDIATFNPTKYQLPSGAVDLDAIREDGVGHLFQSFTVRTRRRGKETTIVTFAQPYSHYKALGTLADCLGLKMAPKTNEYDQLCASLRRYMTDTECSLVVALDKLAHLDIVQRYREQILERGIV